MGGPRSSTRTWAGDPREAAHYRLPGEGGACVERPSSATAPVEGDASAASTGPAVSWLVDTVPGALVMSGIGLSVAVAALRVWRMFTRPEENQVALRAVVSFWKAAMGITPRRLNRMVKPIVLLCVVVGLELAMYYAIQATVLAGAELGNVRGLVGMLCFLTSYPALIAAVVFSVVGGPRRLLLGPSRSMSDAEVLQWLHLALG